LKKIKPKARVPPKINFPPPAAFFFCLGAPGTKKPPSPQSSFSAPPSQPNPGCGNLFFLTPLGGVFFFSRRKREKRAVKPTAAATNRGVGFPPPRNWGGPSPSPPESCSFIRRPGIYSVPQASGRPAHERDFVPRNNGSYWARRRGGPGGLFIPCWEKKNCFFWRNFFTGPPGCPGFFPPQLPPKLTGARGFWGGLVLKSSPHPGGPRKKIFRFPHGKEIFFPPFFFPKKFFFPIPLFLKFFKKGKN